jgi:hypothetical protein
MSITQSDSKCILCGSPITESRPYLNTKGRNLSRKLAHLLPSWTLDAISMINKSVRGKCNAIKINKEFFGNRRLFWCDCCHTGFVFPLFSESELDCYYSDFYWDYRSQNESFFNEESARPLEKRMEFAQARLDWVLGRGVNFSSAIDYGAGDCSGAYAIARYTGPQNVAVIDKSTRTGAIANALNMRHFSSLSGLAPVDFLYASHCIEHVHDLEGIFRRLADVVVSGGHIYLEFPNVEDKDVFMNIVHTPHTFMLSESTIQQLAKNSVMRLVAAETVGPKWCLDSPHLNSRARAILRILLKKE